MCRHSGTTHNHVKADPPNRPTSMEIMEGLQRDGFLTIVGVDWTDAEVEQLSEWDSVWGGEARRAGPETVEDYSDGPWPSY